MERFIQITAEKPADIFGFNWRKGRIQMGLDGDVVIFDPEQEWTVGVFGDVSRAESLPYEGWHLKGKVKRTLVRGIEVWDGKSIVAEKGTGIFVARK